MKKNIFPSFKGFNLLERFVKTPRPATSFREEDLKWIADWGFNFIRIPMDYRFWIADQDPFKIDESGLAEVDRIVQLGQKHHLHVSLNLHRAPGYCVNDRNHEEPFSLWKDAAALDAFCLHWKTLAKRYKGISSKKLSFDLVNEPPAVSAEIMTRADHERVIRKVVAVIKKIDQQRLIIADGLTYGNDPSPELADLGIAQSCRAYLPMNVSHHKASWVWQEDWPKPAWPGPGLGGTGTVMWNKSKLEEHYAPWVRLARAGGGVHCGEGGAYCHTPHKIVLKWLRDVLDVLNGHKIGFALWNFRGSFGILDSNRKDVQYQNWHGHKLDRKLLNLLKKS
jgi:endoglucanase